MTEREYLAAVFATCDRHAARLQWAMARMADWLPLTATRFKTLTRLPQLNPGFADFRPAWFCNSLIF